MAFSFSYICQLIRKTTATKSYKQIESSETKVEEPVVAYRQSVYELTDSERKLVMRSEEAIQAERIYTQAEVDKMVEGWLH